MRCNCCNKILSDYESTRKFKNSGDYVDMCNECFRHIEEDVQVVERDDLDLDEYGIPDSDEENE